jgi:hypothetical protein
MNDKIIYVVLCILKINYLLVDRFVVIYKSYCILFNGTVSTNIRAGYIKWRWIGCARQST